MSPHPSPMASARRFPRRATSLIKLALAAASLALGLSSCSTRLPEPGYVSAPGGTTVSSIRSQPDRGRTEWSADSLPFSGDAAALFDDLGPDYFASLLRNLPPLD